MTCDSQPAVAGVGISVATMAAEATPVALLVEIATSEGVAAVVSSGVVWTVGTEACEGRHWPSFCAYVDVARMKTDARRDDGSIILNCVDCS